MAKCRTLFVVLMGLGMCSAPSVALSIEEDAQAWSSLILSGPAGTGGMLLQMEAQSRFGRDASRLSSIILRPAVGYAVNDRLSLFAGYAYVRNTPNSFTAIREQRTWQQASYTLTKTEGYTLSGRTRLEQRRVSGQHDTGWRLRQQLRLAVPLKSAGGSSAVFWTEGFFAANDTDFGARSGIDRWRNFIGFNVPMNKSWAVEPGYLNQVTNRASGNDAMDHILSVSIALRL